MYGASIEGIGWRASYLHYAGKLKMGFVKFAREYVRECEGTIQLYRDNGKEHANYREFRKVFRQGGIIGLGRHGDARARIHDDETATNELQPCLEQFTFSPATPNCRQHMCFSILCITGMCRAHQRPSIRSKPSRSTTVFILQHQTDVVTLEAYISWHAISLNGNATATLCI